MGAPDLMARLAALGVRLSRDGDDIVAEPRSALTDDARALIRAHRAELLAALGAGRAEQADGEGERRRGVRQSKALAYLNDHPEAARVCIADLSDSTHLVLTIALRAPWAVVELLVRRDRFDAMALLELSLCYPATSVFVREH